MASIPGTSVIDGAGNELRFSPNPTGSFNVSLYRDGVEVATPVVFKYSDSAGKLAAHFPGCNADFVVVDANGSITNG